MNRQHTDNFLKIFGWTAFHADNFAMYREQGCVPARIVENGRDIHHGISLAGEMLLECSGTYMNLVDLGVREIPVTGDWCAIIPYAEGRGRIEAVLPRASAYHRPLVHDREGTRGISDVVAANIDGAAIVQDCKHDFNLRRIERFLALLHADAIPAMLVLTKAAVLEDPESYRLRARSRFAELPIFLVDSLSGTGIAELSETLKPESTLMLVGASGAGKSTLLNALCGTQVARTAEVRSLDGRGRHTTTARQLHVLPNGALLLDTPGIRGVGMNNAGMHVQDSFEDIALLASSCKYSDCTHTGEPGCAVLQALQEEHLEQDRYLNYLHLMREAVGYEETLSQSARKKREIGRLQYLMRRDGHR